MLRSCSLLLGLLVTVAPAVAGDVEWDRIQLDSRFRSEGVAVADFNNDGKNDVVAGDYWYEAPNWVKHEIRPPGDYWAGNGYSHSFCNWAYDINQDGWQDVIIVGFPGDPFHWYENPQGKEGHWVAHEIWHSICNETPLFTDLTGDGKPEVICGSQPEQQMGFLEIPAKDKVNEKWTFTPVSMPGDPATNGTFKYYHGLGATDVNGDGRRDVVIMHGWWEAPEHRHASPWEFHPHILGTEPGQAQRGVDIYAVDFDLDGDQDLISSCAHAYGVWFFERTADEQQPFKTHIVDESFSQTHALIHADINGDGTADFVTGKRYYAHNGGDPGGNDPVVMYWYEVHPSKEGPKFIPHEIRAGRDTGVGTQFQVIDINGDGKLDIALSNKKGVNLLIQR